MKITVNRPSEPRPFTVCQKCEEALHDAGYVLTHDGPWKYGSCDICERKAMVFQIVETKKRLQE